MKYKIILLLNMALLFAGCTDILDIEPNNKVVADKVLTTEEGIAMHMANLYGRLPIEDFSYAIDKGFNLGIGNTDPNNGGRAAAMYCDEAMNSTNGEVKDLIFGKDIRMIKVCIMLLLVFTH